MATEAELAYVDKVGRLFSRQYGVPPMTGRVAGWLLICEPPQQTAAEIATALGASRSAVGAAVSMLEMWKLLLRSRPAGERADRVRIDPAFGMRSLEEQTDHADLAALAREGLELLAGASPSRRGRLVELVAMADWLDERMPALADEWRVHRARLVASGELPDQT